MKMDKKGNLKKKIIKKTLISLKFILFSSKTKTKLAEENGFIGFNQFEILNEFKMLYDNLYQMWGTCGPWKHLFKVNFSGLLVSPLNNSEIFIFEKYEK